MSKILGRFRIRVNGQLYDTMKGASLEPGGDFAESKISSHKVSGYSEAMKASKLDFKIVKSADARVSDVRGWRDVSATFEGDDGSIFTIPKAWTISAKVTDAGEIEVNMEGEPAEEHG